MSVCAVLLVKDEADIIEATVRHLLWHVDEVLIQDNASTDGTHEILCELERDLDPLSVEADPDPAYYQAAKTTALAHEALLRGHRWVIPCDADELWYAPEGRALRDWLAALPREHQFVKAAIYNHLATALDEPGLPFEVMRWRQRGPLDIRWGKVACLCRPDLEIHMGNHSASTHGTGSTAYGLEIRHFPYRSAEQFVRKAVNGAAAYKATDLDPGFGAHWRMYGDMIERGGEEAGRAWFREHFHSADPTADDSLVEDPAPVRS
ncbi:MAG: glycosyltransferase family 2 protein [Myxococcales bacterium]